MNKETGEIISTETLDELKREKEMAEYQEKFFVINKKWLHRRSGIPAEILDQFKVALAQFRMHIPRNKYYVCNQDEPYAQKVIDTILEGESAKDETMREFFYSEHRKRRKKQEGNRFET